MLDFFIHSQLNRIVAMRAYQGLNEATNVWTPVAIDDYQETISYDPNGNIKAYTRNGAPSIAGKATAMDNLGYHYDPGTNQLNHVTDNVSAGNYTEDIDGQSLGNYDYDAIGNLTKDVSEGITDINWTVYGKISFITKNGNTISYTYDASGQRITKTAGEKTTLYVRDASGNVMSVYEIPAVNTIVQKELHLYGSSRLGMALTETKPTLTTNLVSGFEPAITRTLVRGEKVFELSNHLGNVLVTVSDKKIQIPKSNPNQSHIDYYTVDVVAAVDYAPFGMQLSGRGYSSGSKYRYGFNGKEKDISTGVDNYDFGARIYDGRLGRWLSVDPLDSKYTSISPYVFVLNSPNILIDPDGMRVKVRNKEDRDKVQSWLRDLKLSDAFTFSKKGVMKVNRKWAKENAELLSSNSHVSEVYSGLEKIVNSKKHNIDLSAPYSDASNGWGALRFTTRIKINEFVDNPNYRPVPSYYDDNEMFYGATPNETEITSLGNIRTRKWTQGHGGYDGRRYVIKKSNREVTLYTSIMIVDAKSTSQKMNALVFIFVNSMKQYNQSGGESWWKVGANASASFVHYLLDRTDINNTFNADPVKYENHARSIQGLRLRVGNDVNKEDK